MAIGRYFLLFSMKTLISLSQEHNFYTCNLSHGPVREIINYASVFPHQGNFSKHSQDIILK